MQGLGGSFSELVLFGAVAHRQLDHFAGRSGCAPPEVSGVGSHGTDGGAHPPRRFVSVQTRSRAAYHGARPPGVSFVGAQSPNLGAGNQASGERWGCLSLFTVPGLTGEGRQRPRLLRVL